MLYWFIIISNAGHHRKRRSARRVEPYRHEPETPRMNKAGHHITSVALAVAAWPVLSTHGPVDAAAAALGMVAGASAPDWLEGAIWVGNSRLSLLPHRTLTHWPVLWLLAALALFFVSLPLPRMLGYGFVAGSLAHILMDLGTPTGIPLLSPFGQRTSAMLYRAGTVREGFVIVAWCALCFLGYLVTTR